MCGIFFSASSQAYVDPSIETLRSLRSRGPQSFKNHHVAVTLPGTALATMSEADPVVHLTFVSTVLALRGDYVQVQPMIDGTTGSVFCWNGEAWKMGGRTLPGNDTVHVFHSLLDASKSLQSIGDGIESVLTDIAGPFAFIFFDASSQTVYFGRDRLGRRSLMIFNDAEGGLIVASTGIGLARPCTEVDTSSIYKIDLLSPNSPPQRLAWSRPSPNMNMELSPGPGLLPKPSPATIEALISELKASLRLRVMDIPNLSNCPADPNATKIAILFSGGLDCSLLARLAHDMLPAQEPIDLLNVAFENPRNIVSTKDTTTSTPYESCPDRITGRSSFAELLQVYPHRQWRFVAIDVPYNEYSTRRPTIIGLMYPHNTEMDLSIATALYFAARGEGSCLSRIAPDSAPSPTPYTTPARVLLSGLGADELFAGYTRHATSFARGSFAALANELELDFTRIGTRNLGRDDRVMSHWGKEVRYPYLDEDFVRWALRLPVWEKCGFREWNGLVKHSKDIGDRPAGSEAELDPAKMLLRLAAWELGSRRVAGERKRAIQFGARTAKMDVAKGGSKRRGTDVVE